MALTGRAALLAVVGALLVGFVLPDARGFWLVTAAILVLLVLDALLAAPVRGLHVSREGDRAVRLGQPAAVRLTVENPSGRRLRGRVRDAWSPSAGAALQRHDLDVRPGDRQRVTTHLLPTRRGDRHGARVTVRSVGPRIAGRRSGR